MTTHPLAAFVAQTDRLKSKLAQARQCDPKFTVFGASHHRYEVGPALDLTAIAEFETGLGIKLPVEYAAFLTQVGHATLMGRPAAGPFYGIAPLTNTKSCLGGKNGLNRMPVVRPDMSDADWASQTEWFQQDHETLSDAAYDEAHMREMERLYGGLLTLGFQGCQSHSTLVVTGPHKGRVVNIDTEGHKPCFAPDTNFLDWYERWLDEIIAGKLLTPQETWFGYEKTV